MDTYNRIIELVDTNIMYCLPAMLLTLMLLQPLFKDPKPFPSIYRAIKWVIIIYTCINVLDFVYNLLFAEGYKNVMHRATGAYKILYVLMLFSAVLLPFSLLYKKLGRLPVYLFFISIVMKVGWYFERFVIITTSFHRDYWVQEESSWWLSPWNAFYLTWIQGVVLAFTALIVSVLYHNWKVRKSKV